MVVTTQFKASCRFCPLQCLCTKSAGIHRSYKPFLYLRSHCHQYFRLNLELNTRALLTCDIYLALCRKLSTQQLPWAWYQACNLTLWAFTYILSAYAAIFMDYAWEQLRLATIVVGVFATLLEVANSIEEPFRCAWTLMLFSHL